MTGPTDGPRPLHSDSGISNNTQAVWRPNCVFGRTRILIGYVQEANCLHSLNLVVGKGGG